MADPADLEAATGWTVKPEGLCRGSACIAMPRDGSWVDPSGNVDLGAFAAHLRRPVVRDAEHDIWAFGATVDERVARRGSAQAADFTLPDLDGKQHALSDFRGKKGLLVTWASY